MGDQPNTTRGLLREGVALLNKGPKDPRATIGLYYVRLALALLDKGWELDHLLPLDILEKKDNLEQIKQPKQHF